MRNLKKLIENDELERFELRAMDEEEEYENFLIKIVTQIIKLRMVKGITQKELAEKLGTKQSAISRLENMSANPTLKFLYKVLKALGGEIKIVDLETRPKETYKIYINTSTDDESAYIVNPKQKVWEKAS
ncbi:MAG: hypothetical protein DRH12_18240 [Deltaproteobacteria bacterium]|nr:MAG: hypothetical protein DRH12_18240 [Deltaproteobacteria bacterium]